MARRKGKPEWQEKGPKTEKNHQGHRGPRLPKTANPRERKRGKKEKITRVPRERETRTHLKKVSPLRGVEPINVHYIFNHDSTANVICTFRTISVDGRITTILTAVVGEDALKDDRCYSGFTVSGKRVDIMEPWRIPRLGE
ncbi:hypothetical protein TNCV_2526391 [Trichonephila clavipes]|nr:hypothetical protein TNCV_2526391 [Trichonephila clavipes]